MTIVAIILTIMLKVMIARIITILVANTIILMLSLMTAAITTVTAMTIAAMTIRDNGTRKPDITRARSPLALCCLLLRELRQLRVRHLMHVRAS